MKNHIRTMSHDAKDFIGGVGVMIALFMTVFLAMFL